MTTSEIITYILEHKEGLLSSDANYVKRRERVLRELQTVCEEVGGMRDWWWRRVNAPVTVSIASGDGYGVLPTDFDSLGRDGSVTLSPDGDELEWKDEDEMRSRKARTSYDTDRPRFYSIYGQDATTYQPLIQIDNNTAAVSLKVGYNKKFTTLVDLSGDPSDETLKTFPERYHLRVLVPAVEARLALQRGELTQQQFEAQLAVGVRLMMRGEKVSQAGGRGLRGFLGR